MDALWTLVERQYVLETKHARFLESLDPTRTITLFQLLTRDAAPDELDAGWLCRRTFVARMKALADFLDRVTRRKGPYGWDKLPLVFFQASPPDEDEAELVARLAGDPDFPKARRYLPAQVAYLHDETEWTPSLRGTLRRAVIPPLCTFYSPHALGYRLPDYRALLGRVTAATAANYVTRMVGHDVGSRTLPTDVPDRPHLHAVTMLNALRVRTPKFADRWERSISDECTDPMFFLNAAGRINPGDAGKDPLRRHIYNLLQRAYVRNADERTKQLCGLPMDARHRDRCKAVQQVLDAMLRDGYVRFAASYEKAAAAPPAATDAPAPEVPADPA